MAPRPRPGAALFCGGGWYLDAPLAEMLAELGYVDCTATTFRQTYLAADAPRLQLRGARAPSPAVPERRCSSCRRRIRSACSPAGCCSLQRPGPRPLPRLGARRPPALDRARLASALPRSADARRLPSPSSPTGRATPFRRSPGTRLRSPDERTDRQRRATVRGRARGPTLPPRVGSDEDARPPARLDRDAGHDRHRRARARPLLRAGLALGRLRSEDLSSGASSGTRRPPGSPF